MPTILTLFLSDKFIWILLWIYVVGSLIIVIGFKRTDTVRRRDVRIKGALMLGTYIFLSHSVGVMVTGFGYLLFGSLGVHIGFFQVIITTVLAIIVSDGIYIVTSLYLWGKLAIDRTSAIRLSTYSIIVITPWYFFLNLL